MYNNRAKSLTENNEKITIVVTDSGLGGLSVTAGLESGLRKKEIPGKFEIIFFNALAASNYGYNSMSSIEEKADVFDSALKAIELRFNPDLILIACNTLSVVYEHTKFKKNSATIAMGIIDYGIESLIKELRDNSKKNIILLGTPTTISSSVHKNKLVQKGIDERLIINQECPMLESEIQVDPESQKVSEMISEFLSAAGENVLPPHKTTAVLCCTHYGFSQKIFEDAMKKHFGIDSSVVNPNSEMIIGVVDSFANLNGNSQEINLKVYSQVELKQKELNSIGILLEKISPLSAAALKNYHFQKLFDYKEGK